MKKQISKNSRKLLADFSLAFGRIDENSVNF